MSVGRQGKTTNSTDDVMGSKVLDERQATWGEIPGKIVSWDAEKQTGTIQPLYRPRFNGTPVDMPELLEIPIRFPRAGKGGLTFPIKEGDRVTLRPQMRSTENYHTDDDGSASDSRSFNPSDYEAFLDGGESLTDPIKGFDKDNVHLRMDEDGKYGLRGSSDGKIAIDGSEGNIYDLLAQVVELLATDQLQINYGSSEGSGHELSNKAQYAEIAKKLRKMAL